MCISRSAITVKKNLHPIILFLELIVRHTLCMATGLREGKLWKEMKGGIKSFVTLAWSLGTIPPESTCFARIIDVCGTSEGQCWRDQAFFCDSRACVSIRTWLPTLKWSCVQSYLAGFSIYIVVKKITLKNLHFFQFFSFYGDGLSITVRT